MNNKCPKCGGEMEKGLIPTYKIGGIPPSFWIEKIRFLKGLENKHDIQAFRSKKCGYLESYAR